MRAVSAAATAGDGAVVVGGGGGLGPSAEFYSAYFPTTLKRAHGRGRAHRRVRRVTDDACGGGDARGCDALAARRRRRRLPAAAADGSAASVEVEVDGSGALHVRHGGVVYVDALQLPLEEDGWAPTSLWKFGVGGIGGAGGDVLAIEALEVVDSSDDGQLRAAAVPFSVSINAQQYSVDPPLYSYYAPPVVSKLVPASGSRVGGTVVTVVGANFNATSTHRLCAFLGADPTASHLQRNASPPVAPPPAGLPAPPARPGGAFVPRPPRPADGQRPDAERRVVECSWMWPTPPATATARCAAWRRRRRRAMHRSPAVARASPQRHGVAQRSAVHRRRAALRVFWRAGAGGGLAVVWAHRRRHRRLRERHRARRWLGARLRLWRRRRRLPARDVGCSLPIERLRGPGDV